MSITSFDHFIETLECVPAELQHNLAVMAELDKRSGELIRRIDECVKEYRKTDKMEERIALYTESMHLFEVSRTYGNDKIDLAKQTYDLVDKHIRRLESLSGAQVASSEQTNGNNQAKDTNKKHKSGDKSRPNSVNANSNQPIEQPPMAVDMPLDPNEPKYCTCHQVSYGEMIACDNEACPIEWFHFGCVDLVTKPNGKWYCPECFNTNKKGKHKGRR